MFRKQTDNIIVLREIKYKDDYSLYEVFSEHHGKTTYGFRHTKSKKGQAVRLKLRPSYLLEVEYLQSSRFYPRIVSASYRVLYRSIPFDLRKTAIATFMTEILQTVVRGTDPSLFRETEKEFVRLDAGIYHPDFHLHFLKNLAFRLGILPPEPEKGIIFAFENAGNTVKTEESVRHFFQTGKTRNKEERKLLTEWWLQYMAYHTEDFRFPRSHEIFSEILGLSNG